MAWKQDLAKLKQQLDPETPSPAPKPLPRPVPKPGGPAALDDEDAVFLSAMGLKSSPRPAKPVASPGSAPDPVESVPPIPESFQEALKDLKGFKPLVKGILGQPAPPQPTPSVILEAPAQAPLPVLSEVPLAATPEPATPDIQEPEPLPLPTVPLRFQLAAGMAIEVDGVLDLRGHSLSDAMERLKDRLGDGQVLGWRSLQLTLGPDPALHEGFLDLLASGGAPMVARYAQAPIPMGGTQAWLLYFTSLPVPNA